MKLAFSKNKIIIYLKKKEINNINFEDIDLLEECFRDMLLKLKKYIHVQLNGLYQIDVFLDEYYGAVIEMIKIDVDYIEYYSNYIDMNITIENTDFIYLIKDYFDIPNNIKNKLNIYKYENNLYAKIIEKLTGIEFAQLTEMAEIIYNSEDILKSAKKI